MGVKKKINEQFDKIKEQVYQQVVDSLMNDEALKNTFIKISTLPNENVLAVTVREMTENTEYSFGLVLDEEYNMADIFKIFLEKKAELDQQGGHNG